MDTVDWRDRLQPYIRRRAVKRIMNAVRKCCKFDEDELQELVKLSWSFERKTFAGATSTSDYLQKINSKKLAMDRKLQEEIDQKIQMFKEVYLPELIELYQIIASRHQQIQMLKEVNFLELTEMFWRYADGLKQLDFLPPHPTSDDCRELKAFKKIFDNASSFLATPKFQRLSPSFKKRLVSCEKDIINRINSYRPWKMLFRQPVQDPPHGTHTLPHPQPQAQLTRVYSEENQTNSQWQFQQVYPKIQLLKEMYLPELNEMRRVIANKLWQIDSLPHTTESDKRQVVTLDSLVKVPLPTKPYAKPYKYEMPKFLKIKEILERTIAVLRVSESDISPALKEALPLYKDQITTFIRINRSKAPGGLVSFKYKIPVPSVTGNLEEFWLFPHICGGPPYECLEEE